jgi:NlpC/P60 family putative phage cell wall peptidase
VSAATTAELEAQQRAAIVAEALSWVGTPYHHHGKVKGVGVDCAQILVGVYCDTGIVPPVDPGHYARDWHLHQSEEQYLQWLTRGGAHQVSRGRPGDIAVFRFGRTFSHGAILVDDAGTMCHAYVRRAVVLTRLDEAPLAGVPHQWWSIWPERADGAGGA